MSHTDWARQRFLHKVVDLNAGAGDNILSTPVVPDNCCAVVTHIIAWNSDNNFTILWIDVHDDDAVDYHLKMKLTPLQRVPLEFTGKLVLESGDRIDADFWGCTANDDINLYVFGYYIPQFKATTPVR